MQQFTRRRCVNICALLIALLGRTHCLDAKQQADINQIEVVHKNRSPIRKENSRFLNIFSIIDIPSTTCQSSLKPLRELNGTCYHPNQCSKLGGVGLGKCADGYGVCCHCNISTKWIILGCVLMIFDLCSQFNCLAAERRIKRSVTSRAPCFPFPPRRNWIVL